MSDGRQKEFAAFFEKTDDGQISVILKVRSFETELEATSFLEWFLSDVEDDSEKVIH